MLLDLDALRRAPLRHDPCDYVVVPEFVPPEALAAINRDYPDIEEPGNFPPDQLHAGPAFEALVKELESPEVRAAFEEKFGLDLSPYTFQATVRRWSEASDGNVHNDSKAKIVTALIYFNERWTHEGGRLRLIRDPKNIDDYAAEVVPERGTLLAFRRSEHSYHGFVPVETERRSLQMYWVVPKRTSNEERKNTPWRRIKRFLKGRS